MAESAEHPPLRHIVVPIDGSAAGARALPFASRLGRDFDLPLSIVSVITDFRSEAGERVATLEEILDTFPPFVDCRIVQSPATAKAIAEESADGLVCMASSGRLFDADGIHGSTAEFVTATATCPVIVLGPECEEDPPVDRVLVAIDPSHDQHGLTAWAMRLGYHLDVPVEFVHVDVGDDAPLGPRVRRIVCDEGETVPERLVAEATGAVLALGSHGRTGFARLLEGSVGAAVLATATQPVMILGPEATI